MKKIFAIALALVMVLSMASAFATTCPTIDWACGTYTCETGKGSVAVIPYVKGNACGGDGVAFTTSTCAGAVNTEDVFFAVKVTVEADPSEDWWADAALTVSQKGLVSMKADAVVTDGVFSAGKVAGYIRNANEGELKAGEYYLVFVDTAWTAVPAADFVADKDSLWFGEVNNATIAKVCAKLTAKADLADEFEIAGYKVKYSKGATEVLEISKGGKTVYVYVNSDEKIDKFIVNAGAGDVTVKTYSPDKTAFWNENQDKALSWACTDEGAFLKAVMEAFKFDFGTCITDKAVKANFAWDDKVEACFSWNSNAQAVVNAECVVAIPKTGDASVLAWLF